MGGWNVVSVGAPPNGSGSAPPQGPAAPPTDPWAVVGVGNGPSAPPQPVQGQQQPPQPPPGISEMRAHDPTVIERGLQWLRDPNNAVVNRFLPGISHEAIAGAVKDTGSVIGNVLAMVNHSTTAGLNDTDAEKIKQTPSYHAVRDAADWLRSGGAPQGLGENIGALGAQALQLMGPEGLLRLVGPIGEGIETVGHLDQAKQIATVLTKNPKIAGYLTIGIKAAKEALTQAGLQYAHTMDPTDAAIAGVTGGAAGAVAHALQPGVATAMERYGTKTVPIEGAGNVRLSPGQIDEAGRLTTVGAETPEVSQEQQEAFRRFESSTARKGTAKILNDVNQTRVPAAAGEKPEPFTFTLEPNRGAEREEPGGSTVTGQPEDVRIVRQPGQGTRAVPSEGFTPEEGAPDAAHATIYPPATVTRPEGHKIISGGALQTQDLHQAVNWLSQYEEAISDPGFKNLPQATQDTIRYGQKNLEDQISLYHAANPNARFAPIDAEAAARDVQTPAQAATVLRTHAQPITDTLDSVSDGQFSKWREQERKAQDSLMRSDNTAEQQDRLHAQINEARANMNNIYLRNGDKVTAQDFAQWKQMQRGAYVMDGLDQLTKKMANGVTPETTATANLQRYVRGDHQAFENWLKDPKFGGATERDLTNMIGEEGVNNYRQMFTLLDGAQNARKTNEVLKNIVGWKGFHPSVLGLSAYPVHLLTGMGMREALATTAAVGGTAWAMKKVFQLAADNPKFGSIIQSAVRNDIAPKYYAPLATRTLMQMIQKDSPTHDDDEPQETPKK